MPGEIYRRRLRSLLLSFYQVFPALINSLVCRDSARALWASSHFRFLLKRLSRKRQMGLTELFSFLRPPSPTCAGTLGCCESIYIYVQIFILPAWFHGWHSAWTIITPCAVLWCWHWRSETVTIGCWEYIYICVRVFSLFVLYAFAEPFLTMTLAVRTQLLSKCLAQRWTF